MSRTVGRPSRLSGGAVPIKTLREDCRKEFEDILAGLGGNVLLMSDPALLPVLRHVAMEGTQYLKEHNVQYTVELSEDAEAPGGVDTVLFLVLPTLAMAQCVVAQVQAANARGSTAALHVCFLPRKTHSVVQHLKDQGVWGDLSVCEWGLDVLPLDDDLLTLVGQDTYYRDSCCGDTSGLSYFSSAITKLQGAFGVIPQVKAVGKLAKAVAEVVLREQREREGAARGSRRGGGETGGGDAAMPTSSSSSSSSSAPAPPSSRSLIDTLIILDRGVDLVTPLVTPFTVEAQFREWYGVAYLMADVPAQVVTEPDAKAPPPPGARATLHLNSNDKVYSEIRDVDVKGAERHLNTRAKEQKRFEEEISSREGMQDLDKVRKVVKKMPGFLEEKKSLKILLELLTPIYTALVSSDEGLERWQLEQGLLEEDKERWKDVGEEVSYMLAGGRPLTDALRLLTLSSVVAGGLRYKDYDAARREIIAYFGLPALFTLERLEAGGLLGYRGGVGGVASMLGSTSVVSGKWGSLVKHFNLITTADEAGADIHYVTLGYAPLSVRICERGACTGSGWESDTVKLLPGPVLQVTQRGAAMGGGGGGGGEEGLEPGARKVVLVCYVGGVTHVEISALRSLSEKYPVDFLILATSIIDGGSLIRSFFDPMQEKYGDTGDEESGVGSGSRGGAGRGGGASGGDEEGEEGEEEEELDARQQVIKNMVDKAGKLDPNYKTRPPPEKAKKGMFGGLFGK